MFKYNTLAYANRSELSSRPNELITELVLIRLHFVLKKDNYFSVLNYKCSSRKEVISLARGCPRVFRA